MRTAILDRQRRAAGRFCRTGAVGAGLALLPLLTGCGATAAGTPAPVAATGAALPSSATPAPRAAVRVRVVVRRRHTRRAQWAASGPVALRLRVVTLVDSTRRIRLPNGSTEPRTLRTLVRYPAVHRGPLPLIVFGHGFAVSPVPYARLLRAWARAGYVVAAPYFPLERAGAPGGPDETDLINQPADMRLVITRMLVANRVPGGALSGLVDPTRIAVAGQSDGGETALAVAYNRHFVDHRVGAAVILSGARLPGDAGGLAFPAPAPPLLAVQGTADPINLPASTDDFWRPAPRPKFLLHLLGASHLPPYTTEQPQLTVVAKVTIAFLDRYLKGRGDAGARLLRDGHVPGVAALSAVP